jgi:ATP-dependent Zn protease
VKIIGFCLACCLSFASSAAPTCQDSDSAPASIESLSVTGTSFAVSDDQGRRMMTTLGTLKNSSSSCFESVVVEVKYLDSRGQLIDSITQSLFRVVAPPSQEVAIRIRDEAAHPKEAYASQTLRIVDAEPRTGSRGAKSIRSVLVDSLANWGPMLLLIGVWIFFMQRMKRKDSPQGRTLALMERQIGMLASQNALIERIAVATEARSRAQNGP